MFSRYILEIQCKIQTGEMLLLLLNRIMVVSANAS